MSPLAFGGGVRGLPEQIEVADIVRWVRNRGDNGCGSSGLEREVLGQRERPLEREK